MSSYSKNAFDVTIELLKLANQHGAVDQHNIEELFLRYYATVTVAEGLSFEDIEHYAIPELRNKGNY
ncbi:hypothetical protein [Mangrovibacillus cuniculi]|uniref:Uncharacterized protein n=1 Tax=Mangrovibacillus cuniculi TaxID=2593652 RepID=A0A7S8CBA0_9BACI|nr:hypothetical protein [Mangrovibacillus cuniculi]QPC46814.1 hypothetical protein G8O30_07480 [Mangrovibacillus cuniculi]